MLRFVNNCVHYKSKVFWIMDPELLCKPVTGEDWRPPAVSKGPKALQGGGDANNHGNNIKKVPGRKSSLKKEKNPNEAESEKIELARATRLRRHKQLADYVLAQFMLMTNMCKGRSYNPISWLEKSFPYDMLLNLCSNELLPHRFRAAAVDFVQALYIDRFPQIAKSGAPCLPEKLFVFDEEQYEGARRSTTPVLRSSITLSDNTAFPSFSVPLLSSAHGDPNPVISHPDHFKFFLVRTLCNSTIRGFGGAGRIVHSLAEVNAMGGAVLRGQET